VTQDNDMFSLQGGPVGKSPLSRTAQARRGRQFQSFHHFNLTDVDGFLVGPFVKLVGRIRLRGIIGIPALIMLGEDRKVFPFGVTNFQHDRRPDKRSPQRRVGPLRDRTRRHHVVDGVKRIVPDTPRSRHRQSRCLLRPSLTQRHVP
jgi:hypothetical protein